LFAASLAKRVQQPYFRRTSPLERIARGASVADPALVAVMNALPDARVVGVQDDASLERAVAALAEQGR